MFIVEQNRKTRAQFHHDREQIKLQSKSIIILYNVYIIYFMCSYKYFYSDFNLNVFIRCNAYSLLRIFFCINNDNPKALETNKNSSME